MLRPKYHTVKNMPQHPRGRNGPIAFGGPAAASQPTFGTPGARLSRARFRGERIWKNQNLVAALNSPPPLLSPDLPRSSILVFQIPDSITATYIATIDPERNI